LTLAVTTVWAGGGTAFIDGRAFHLAGNFRARGRDVHA
jgi:hypothetical protein